MADCSVDGCTNCAKKAGLCWGHWKRKMKGKEVNVPLEPERGSLSPWQLLEKAIQEYWECDVKNDIAFERARKRVAYAARRFASSRRRSSPTV